MFDCSDCFVEPIVCLILDTELEPLSVDVEISADAAEADEAAEEYDYPTWLGEVKL